MVVDGQLGQGRHVDAELVALWHQEADLFKKEKEDKATPVIPAVRIDFEGMNARITSFPLKSDDYALVLAIDSGILYFKDKEIKQFKLDDKKDSLVISGVDSGVLSVDGQKILYQAEKQFGIIELKADQKTGEGALNFTQMTMKLDPQKEWVQIFNDGWRIFRDWFYQKTLHGVDWLKMKEKYSQLVPHLSHRADLDFIFGELVGEINAGHTYVYLGGCLIVLGEKVEGKDRVALCPQGRNDFSMFHFNRLTASSKPCILWTWYG